MQTEVVQSRVVIWCSNDLLKSRIGQKAGDGLVMRSFGAEQGKMVQSRVVIWCRADQNGAEQSGDLVQAGSHVTFLPPLEL